MTAHTMASDHEKSLAAGSIDFDVYRTPGIFEPGLEILWDPKAVDTGGINWIAADPIQSMSIELAKETAKRLNEAVEMGNID